MAQGPATGAVGESSGARDVFGIVGATLAGNFQVERVVAEGGFGVVYRAHHGGFRAPVALKCLKVPTRMTAAQRSAFLEAFRSEAELLFRLSASIPEIVRPLHHDVMTLPDGRLMPLLALEWLEGEPFDRIITRRRLEGQAPIGIHKLVRMLRPVATALARAHRFAGPSGRLVIVHRDIKPDNIYFATVNGVDMVKILDFGIAKSRSAASAAAGRDTGDEALPAFTAAYASPEQWQPKTFGQTGPWTDVWGLALTMVEALSGRQPIDGEMSAMMGTTLDERRRPTPRAEGVMVSDEVEAVFTRALAVDPRRRTRDIETFWNELEDALGIPRTFASYDPRSEDVPVSQRGRTASGSMGAAAYPSASPSAPPASGPPVSRQALASGEAELPALELGPVSRPPTPAAARAPLSEPPAQGPALELELGVSSPAPSARPVPPPGDFVGEELELAPPPPSNRGLGAEVAPLEPAPATRSLRPPVEAIVTNLASDGPPAALQPDGARIELAAVPISRPPSRAPSAGSLRAGPVSRAPTSRPNQAVADIGERLRLPAKLIGAAIAITLLDVVIAKITGSPVSLGPVKSFWLAAPLAIAGTGVAIWRLLGG